MFNMAGEVIGIVSHIISKSGGSEGLGFVVTINTAKQFLLEKHSFWSGMEGELVSGTIAAIMNVPQRLGFLVTAVANDSPSARAGGPGRKYEGHHRGSAVHGRGGYHPEDRGHHDQRRSRSREDAREAEKPPLREPVRDHGAKGR
jgi:S1-C subfamily serine protease